MNFLALRKKKRICTASEINARDKCTISMFIVTTCMVFLYGNCLYRRKVKTLTYTRNKAEKENI